MKSTDSERRSIEVHRNVPATMRDGTVLRADVYRPREAGPFPVLLDRTPYGKGTPRYVDCCSALAAAGYIAVMQDVRGRYDSDGEFTFLFAGADETGEGPDGFDTVEWAASLDGSDGRVGIYGNSYDGFTSLMVTVASPPSLAGVLVSGMSARFLDMNFGIFDTGRRLQWLYALSGDTRRRAGEPGPHNTDEALEKWAAHERGKWIWYLPLEDLPDRIFSSLAPPLRQHLREQTRELWDFFPHHPNFRVPVCVTTGWYDRLNAATDHFTRLSADGPPDLRHRHRLVIGPWGHDTASLVRRQGVLDFGPEADTTYADLVQRWYDHLFKGIDNGLTNEPPVRLFVMGPNTWRLENEWPLARTRYTDYFLRSGGGLATTPPGGGEPPDDYTYDPRDPLMSVMDANSHLAPCELGVLDDRPDRLVYETPPLERPLEVTGPVEARLWIASDAPDTDFCVKLAHVDRTGRAVNLCHGIARCRYRDGFDREVFLEPGVPVEIAVRLLPTCRVFAPGERIRIDIASSDFPNFDRNHNTGRDFWSDGELREARQTVFHDVNRPSRIILPVIPGEGP